MAKRTVSDWKHGRYPFPVYVATFPDGETIRMSFWSREGKPFDFDRGRRLCEQVRATQDRLHRYTGGAARPMFYRLDSLRWPLDPWRYYDPCNGSVANIITHPERYPVESPAACFGQVEIAGLLQATDPVFVPATEQPRRKRVTVRELKDTLAAIIRLPELSRDQQVVQAARLIDQARGLLAA